MLDWQTLDSAPKPESGATWGPKFLLSRDGMRESIAIGQYQSCLLEPQSFVLEVAALHARAHEDLPYTHWARLPMPAGIPDFDPATGSGCWRGSACGWLSPGRCGNARHGHCPHAARPTPVQGNDADAERG